MRMLSLAGGIRRRAALLRPLSSGQERPPQDPRIHRQRRPPRPPSPRAAAPLPFFDARPRGPAARSPARRRCCIFGRLCCRGLGRFCCRVMHGCGFVPVRKPFHHRRLGIPCVFRIRREVSQAAERPAAAKKTIQRRGFPDFLLATPLQVLDGEHQQRVAFPGRMPHHLALVVHRHLLALQRAARVQPGAWRSPVRLSRADFCPFFAAFPGKTVQIPYRNRTFPYKFRTPQRSRKRADSHMPRGIFALRAVTGDRNKTQMRIKVARHPGAGAGAATGQFKTVPHGRPFVC